MSNIKIRGILISLCFPLFFSTSSFAEWATMAVDTGGGSNVGMYSSIAIDSNNYPHIAYYEMTSPTYGVRYTYWDGDSWVITKPYESATLGDGEYCRLALDDSDNPHIVFVELSTSEMVYYRNLGSSWDVFNAGFYGIYLDMEIGTDNYPRVVYNDPSDGASYAEWNGSSFTTEDVDISSTAGYFCSLALDPSNNDPFISYQDQMTTNLMYANRVGASWTIEVVDSSTNVGSYSSIALNPNSPYYPHIAYYDQEYSELKHTHWDGAVWNNTIPVPSGGDGEYTSIVVDGAGNPHISYYDIANGNLKYLYFDGSTWTATVVDDSFTFDQGKYTSIALNSLDYPVISYYDQTNELLKLARFYLGKTESQGDWSGGGGQTDPVTEWGDTFHSQTDIDYSAPGQLTLAQTKDFALNGELNSAILDLGDEANPRWMEIDWTADTPTSNASTVVTIQMRTGNAWGAMGSWSGDIITPGSLQGIIPDGERYVQYKIKLSTDDVGVTPTFYDITVIWEDSTGIDDGENGSEPNIPTGFMLEQSYPNPTDNAATIKFALPVRSTVSLELFDIKGRKIATIAEGEYDAGEYATEVGNLTNGIYLYRLKADEFTVTKKMIVR